MVKTGGKKEERGKRNFPRIPPYRERGKKKEQCGCVCTGDCSQYRARVREYLRTRGWTRRRLYDEAGAAADEIVATCFGSADDHRKWAARMYQYPWAIVEFREMAYEKASCYRAGELRNPVAAFQHWINENYPNPRGNSNSNSKLELTTGGAR